MNRTVKQILWLMLLIGLDQWTKQWIEQQSVFFHMTIIDGFFNLVRAHNTGVAFSMFTHGAGAWHGQLILGITIGIAVAVSLWWWRERNRYGIEPWLLITIIAGAAGNIMDRVQYGYVIDFIQWYVVISGKAYVWPSFNIADACISVSVVMLLLTSFRRSASH